MSTVDLSYPGDLAAGTGLDFRNNLNDRIEAVYAGLLLHQAAIEAALAGFTGDGTMPDNTAVCSIDSPTAGQVYCPAGYKAVVGGVPVVTTAILSQGYTASALNHVFLVLSSAGVLSLRVSTSADINANEVWIADVTAVPAIDNTPVGKIVIGSVPQNARTRVTAAQINVGKTLRAVASTRKFRLIDFSIIPIGGNAAGVTSIDLMCGAVVLASIPCALLQQSAIIKPDTQWAGVALADGASFVQMTAGDDVTIIKNGSDVTTMTNLDVILTYVIE